MHPFLDMTFIPLTQYLVWNRSLEKVIGLMNEKISKTERAGSINGRNELVQHAVGKQSTIVLMQRLRQ